METLDQGKLIREGGWKQLIILDACRYDYFEQEWAGGGELQKVRTQASCTLEWAPYTFSGKYEDVVYLSTIPYIGGVRHWGWSAQEHFFKVVLLWKAAWNEAEGTVLPESVREAARIEGRLNGNKRLILHFGQPHFPYIGETRISGFELLGKCRESIINGGNGIVQYDRKFNVDADVWRQAYRDNLRRVLEVVKSIVGPGTVITADHGELLGEGGGRLHPCGSNNPILLNVPWLVVG